MPSKKTYELAAEIVQGTVWDGEPDSIATEDAALIEGLRMMEASLRNDEVQS